MCKHLTGIVFVFLFTFASILSANQHGYQIKFKKKYLNIPVCENEPIKKISIKMDGIPDWSFTTKLAKDSIDYWMFIDLSRFKGEKVLIRAEDTSTELLQKLLVQSNEFIGIDQLYQEKFRPQIHFTSCRGWLNDPNGLVYHDGLYHLFYQHNPYGTGWGNMHWGHAVSTDLLHWKDDAFTFGPANFGDWQFSGSAVVDLNNTSGFAKKGKVPLVAFYTSTGRGEVGTYSLDNGKSWTEFENNPIISDVEKYGRDPKVFWHEETQKWIMVLFIERAPVTNKNNMESTQWSFDIYTSDNMKDWAFASHASDAFFECPEFFPLPVDGDPQNIKWVMHGGNGNYQIGSFDGTHFLPETEMIHFFHDCFYASQTYNNTPDNKRIRIAWGRGVECPEMPFNQVMLFPTELTLKTTANGIRLFSNPVDQIKLLHKRKIQKQNIIFVNDDTLDLSKEIHSDLLHIKAEFEIEDSHYYGFEIFGFKIIYDKLNHTLNQVFLMPQENKINVEIIVDKTSIEIFANEGRLFLANAHIPKNKTFKVFTNKLWDRNCKATLNYIEINELESIWK